MTIQLASEICTVISLMDGFPAWHGEAGEALEERYSLALLQVPDAVGLRIRVEVDRHFAKRPPVKDLLDWAKALSTAKSFHISDLEGANPNRRVLPAPALRSSIPPHVRRVFDELRRKEKRNEKGVTLAESIENAGDCGLVHDFGDGRIERTLPRLSRAEAQRRAGEMNAKYTHFRASIYQAETSAGDLSASAALLDCEHCSSEEPDLASTHDLASAAVSADNSSSSNRSKESAMA